MLNNKTDFLNVKDLDDRCYRQKIYQIGRAFNRLVESEWNGWLEFAKVDLCISEHIILNILNEYGVLSVSDISKIGVLHISTALNYAKKLEKRELIVLKKSREDLRVTYAEITESGIALIEMLEERWDSKKSSLITESHAMETLYGKKPDYQEIYQMLLAEYGAEELRKILN